MTWTVPPGVTQVVVVANARLAVVASDSINGFSSLSRSATFRERMLSLERQQEQEQSQRRGDQPPQDLDRQKGHQARSPDLFGGNSSGPSSPALTIQPLGHRWHRSWRHNAAFNQAQAPG
jgi:hypothetical protein